MNHIKPSQPTSQASSSVSNLRKQEKIELVARPGLGDRAQATASDLRRQEKIEFVARPGLGDRAQATGNPDQAQPKSKELVAPAGAVPGDHHRDAQPLSGRGQPRAEEEEDEGKRFMIKLKLKLSTKPVEGDPENAGPENQAVLDKMDDLRSIDFRSIDFRSIDRDLSFSPETDWNSPVERADPSKSLSNSCFCGSDLEFSSSSLELTVEWERPAQDSRYKTFLGRQSPELFSSSSPERNLAQAPGSVSGHLARCGSGSESVSDLDFCPNSQTPSGDRAGSLRRGKSSSPPPSRGSSLGSGSNTRAADPGGGGEVEKSGSDRFSPASGTESDSDGDLDWPVKKVGLRGARRVLSEADMYAFYSTGLVQNNPYNPKKSKDTDDLSKPPPGGYRMGASLMAREAMGVARPVPAQRGSDGELISGKGAGKCPPGAISGEKPPLDNFNNPKQTAMGGGTSGSVLPASPAGQAQPTSSAGQARPSSEPEMPPWTSWPLIGAIQDPKNSRPRFITVSSGRRKNPASVPLHVSSKVCQLQTTSETASKVASGCSGGTKVKSWPPWTSWPLIGAIQDRKNSRPRLNIIIPIIIKTVYFVKSGLGPKTTMLLLPTFAPWGSWRKHGGTRGGQSK